MWDLFNESGAVANSTSVRARAARRWRPSAGCATGPAKTPPKRGPSGSAGLLLAQLREPAPAGGHASQMFMSNVRIVVNLCMSDMFDRYPKLKIVSAESGIGWVPFILETLEYQLDEMITEPDEVSYQQRRPSEYFRTTST